MRRLFKTVVVVASALGLLGASVGCGSSAKTGGSSSTSTGPSSSTTVPVTTAPSTAAPTSTTSRPATSMDVRVYFLLGEHIAVAHRSVPATISIARTAVQQLLAGPSPVDTAAGMASAVPTGTRLLGINIAKGMATVDLSGTFASGGGSLSMTARLAQVTYTLTQFPTVQGVLFRMDGQPVSVFGGEGIILDHPATRSSFESLTPPILVEFPGSGWTVHSPLRVAGTANVYEAQFQAKITDRGGRVIAIQAVHATSGTGTRGTFDATIPFGGATGPATLTVFDSSPKDGSPIDVVNIPVVLAAG